MKPKNKNPKDCPHCGGNAGGEATLATVCLEAPTPWSQRKGKGGRKKSKSTQNYFCSNPRCAYYLIAEEGVHALVGYGWHGKNEEIQDLKCQACGKKFTVRKHTVLYRLKTHSRIVCLALNLLALGVDISELREALEIRESTRRTLLTRSGEHGHKLRERFFILLDVVHIQLDELWANVKQAQQDIQVWTACDAKTKLIPVLQLGPRSQEMAYAVVHELKARLRPGRAVHRCSAQMASSTIFTHSPPICADGSLQKGKSKAVWLILETFLYAQVIKHQRRYRLVDVEQRVIWGLPGDYRSRLKGSGLSGNINTSFVERANLRIRQGISKLTRRTWGTPQFTTELGERLSWWLALYHFSRYHQSLRIKMEEPMQRRGNQRRREYGMLTPAVAAGLTGRHWSVMELISYPLAQMPGSAPDGMEAMSRLLGRW